MSYRTNVPPPVDVNLTEIPILTFYNPGLESKGFRLRKSLFVVKRNQAALVGFAHALGEFDLALMGSRVLEWKSGQQGRI